MNFSCTCIPPSAGGKRRRQLHWRRESLWDSNLQPDKWKWKQEVKVKMKKVKVGQHSATWQISVWNNTFNIFTTSKKWKLSPWDSNLKHDNTIKIASESGSCTSMHSKERVESVCHSLPERNSQDAASKERTKWLLVLFLLTHIYQDTFYQLFLHTLQSPHWSRFPPKSDFEPGFQLQNSISTHTAEVVWYGPSLKVVKWILRRTVFCRLAIRMRMRERTRVKTLRK